METEGEDGLSFEQDQAQVEPARTKSTAAKVPSTRLARKPEGGRVGDAVVLF